MTKNKPIEFAVLDTLLWLVGFKRKEEMKELGDVTKYEESVTYFLSVKINNRVYGKFSNSISVYSEMNDKY